MTGRISVTFDQIEALSSAALRASGVAQANAAAVAHSIAAAERDGQPIVGLSYLPVYCDHAACGKVDGQATPTVTRLSSGGVSVDAATGFAHPAIAAGLPLLAEAARDCGLAALSVANSYACGSLGYFIEQLAEQGLVALMVANASPSIAPYGGKVPFFGTNPIAFAAPRAGHPPLVIDQSSSVVAKVAVIDAHRRGVPLPAGWALDADGHPTTDAEAAMAGSLAAIGGYKGVGLALIVDLLAGGLSGSHLSFEASSFGNCEGGPPRTGQFILALNPAGFGAGNFAARCEALLAAMTAEPQVRLPGARRQEARARNTTSISVDQALWQSIADRAVVQPAPAP